MTRMVTVPEAARELGICSTTIIRYIKKGIMSGEKYGGIYLIPSSEMPRMKEELKRDPREAQRQKLLTLNIPRLYQLCSQEKFAEVAEHLGIAIPPHDCRECYALVNQIVRGKQPP